MKERDNMGEYFVRQVNRHHYTRKSKKIARICIAILNFPLKESKKLQEKSRREKSRRKRKE